MSRYLSILLLAVAVKLFSPMNVFGKNIAENELKSVPSVKFKNYEGRILRSSTVHAIKGIGKYLAANPNKLITNYQGKYKVIRVRDKNTKLYDADIISILPSAKVNNIKNVKRIIAGFLQEAYAYSSSDSQAIAQFVVYYNAHYRNNSKYVKEKYSKAVNNYLKDKKIGLSTHYLKWAGSSSIMIPLLTDDLGGGINSLEVANKDIKNDVRNSSNKDEKLKPSSDLKSTKEEKAITKVEEKQIKESKQAIADDKESNKEEKKQLIDQKKDLEKKKSQSKNPEEKKDLEAQIKETDQAIKDNQKEASKIQKTQKTVEKQEKDLKKSKPKASSSSSQKAPQSSPVNTSSSSSSAPKPKPTQEQKTAQMENTIQKQEKKLAKQEKQLNRQEKVEENKFFFLKKIRYFNGNFKDSSLVMMDAISKKVLKTSELNTISGNQFEITEQGIMLVARENPKSSFNHLTLLDKKSLSILKVGEENIYARGIVRVKNPFIYAVFEKNKEFYLGQFNIKDLKLIASSDDPVDKDTFVSFYKDKIYLSNKDGNVMILKSTDMTVDSKDPIMLS